MEDEKEAMAGRGSEIADGNRARDFPPDLRSGLKTSHFARGRPSGREGRRDRQAAVNVGFYAISRRARGAKIDHPRGVLE